jgi:hypothetical protein
MDFEEDNLLEGFFFFLDEGEVLGGIEAEV